MPCLDMLCLVFFNLPMYGFSLFLIDRCLAKGSPGCSHPASSNPRDQEANEALQGFQQFPMQRYMRRLFQIQIVSPLQAGSEECFWPSESGHQSDHCTAAKCSANFRQLQKA